MVYFGEGLGQTWMRDNSAYHEAQKHDPLCGSRVVITDRDCEYYGRHGVIAKVTEYSPIYKITLNENRYGEEFTHLDKWQFKIIED